MKKLITAIISLILVICFCLTLATMANTTGDSETETVAPSYENFTSENTVTVNISNSYSVIMPPDANLKEYTCYLTNQSNWLAGIIGGKLGMGIPVYDDTSSPSEFEIIVGNTTRTESAKFGTEVDYAAYGIKVVGQKLIVFGHSARTADMALNVLVEKINAAEVVDGNIVLTLPETQIWFNENWCYDFPRFTAGKFAAVADGADGDMLWAYTDTSETDFDNYCKLLINDGYKLEYCNKPVYGCFAFLRKDSKAIYVSYVYSTNETRLATGYNKNLPPFEAGHEALDVEEKGPFSPIVMLSDKKTYDFETVTQPKITHLTFDEEANRGLGFVITLSDGSFLIVDGGNSYNPTHVHIWNVLNELNERPDGKIVIAGWYITHAHGDHYNAYLRFAETYGSQCELKYFMFNNSDVSEIQGCQWNYVDHLQYFGGNPQVITLYRGQRLQFADAVLEVLTTADDLFPFYTKYYSKPLGNDQSVVTKLELGGQTMTILGDAELTNSAVTRVDIGEYIESDFMQITHHGYGLLEYELYDLIGASFGFWPNELKYFNEFTAQGTSSTRRSHFWSHKHILYFLLNHIEMSGDYDPTVVLPFDFKTDKVVETRVPLS